jgi:protein-disulfide isomerase
MWCDIFRGCFVLNNKIFMKTSHLIIIIGIIVVLIGWAIFDSRSSTSQPNGNQKNESVSVVSDSDIVKGNKNSKVVLVEYSDFQCPACRTYFPIVKQLSEEFANDIQIVYRHFPLSSIHPNAEKAARAAEAAGKQGKFWEMHDLLFGNQTNWSNLGNPENAFKEYATSLGLAMDQYEADFNSGTLKEKVISDYRSGQSAGVSGTPSFYLNGVKLNNIRNYQSFKKLVEDELAKNGG